MNYRKRKVRIIAEPQKEPKEIVADEEHVKLPQLLLLSILAIPVCLLICMVYQLNLPFTIAMLVVTLLFLPGWIKNYGKSRYEAKRLLDAQIYMEQLLYGFARQGKILTALQEIMPLFPKGTMHETLKQSIHTILYDLKEEDSLQSGLSIIEHNYQNERLYTIHRYLYKVEMLGGDYEGILSLLQKDLSGWRTRIELYQKQCKRARSNVWIAIAIALFICMITNYILPAKVGIANNMVYMISTVALLVILLITYTRMDRKLAVNWLQYGYCSEQGTQEKRYERFLNYNPKKERKTGILLAILPTVIALYEVIQKNWILAITILFLITFLLNQHKIGNYLLKKNLTKELEKAFPQWLMELSLLLQVDNVQVAITKTMQRAPSILKPALHEFQEGITRNPESVQPYLDFLKDFSLPQIQSAMKMLYAISAGNNGNEQEQLEELIARNQQLMHRSEVLMDEDSMAGMYLLFLSPAVAGAMKLICDMTVFLTTFLGQVSV